MKKIMFILSLAIILLTNNCASLGGSKSRSANGISVEKKEGFNPSTKKVSTLSVYHLSKQKMADKSDAILNTLGASIDGKIAEIYGSNNAGGDAIVALAKKLNLKNFDSSVKNLIDSQVSGIELTAESKKTLSTITDKGKIDALAFPVASDGFETLKSGGEISIYVIVYDGKSSMVQVLGKREGITAKKEDIALVESKPDQARANINLSLLIASGELLDEVKKAIKQIDNVKVTKEDKPKEIEESSEKAEEPEALSKVDDWLVSKIKVGLGPIGIGIVGILFLIL